MAFIIINHVPILLSSCSLLTVSSMLTETKQYFTLYNTLEDQKAYMEKEVIILL